MEDIPLVNSNGADQFDRSQVPTLDEDVRHYLIQWGQPEEVEGESKGDRRDRLIAKAQELDYRFTDAGDVVMVDDEEEDEEDEEFYTPGGDKVLKVRTDLLHTSIPNARSRVDREYRNFELNRNHTTQRLKFERQVGQILKTFTIYGTESLPNNTRTLSAVRFQRGTKELIACGSWDGSVHFIGQSDLATKFRSASHHSEKVSGLDWNHDGTLALTGGGEGRVNFWKVDEHDGINDKITPSATLEAHENRITKVIVHPTSLFFATTSGDQTWKLWDMATQEPVWQQEGHSKEVFAGAFHPDGSLFVSGGLDGVSRVTDLRSGRNIVTVQGHAKGVYALDFAPNGYQWASGSGDGTIKIWDLRKLQRSSTELFTIPAHKKLVSDVRWVQGNLKAATDVEFTDENDANPVQFTDSGSCIVSSSYDGSVGVYSANSWVRQTSLTGHTDKVMSCDIDYHGTQIVSCGWDRTVKLWKP
ncbi:U4/U6 small nuclear ribonucleoprotein Prp4p [Diutina catenulata]